MFKNLFSQVLDFIGEIRYIKRVNKQERDETMFFVQYFSYSDITTDEFSSVEEAKNFFDKRVVDALASPNWTCGNMEEDCIQLLDGENCIHAIRLGDLR